MANAQLKAYQPTPNELECLRQIEAVGGKRLANFAHPVIYRRVTGFGDHIRPEDEKVIREIARKCDVDLIC